MTFTYNGRERGTDVPTHGGYSTRIVSTEDYVLRIPDGSADAAAPLLCAGITTIRRCGISASSRATRWGWWASAVSATWR